MQVSDCDNNESIHRYDCAHGYRYNNSTNTNSG